MRRSKHGFDWREDQQDFDFFDEAEFLENESRASSARQRSGSVARSKASDVSSNDVSKQMAAAMQSRRANRSVSFDVTTDGAQVNRPRSQTVATGHAREKQKLGVWGGQLAKKVVDRITPLSEEVLCKLAEFLTPTSVSNLCMASKKLEKKLTSKSYWCNQLQAHGVRPHTLWTKENEEKVARKCLQCLLSYGSRLCGLQHAAITERGSAPTVVKLLPLPTPHIVTVFKDSGEVSVWDVQTPGHISEKWSYLNGSCEAANISDNGRLVVQTTKTSEIVIIDLADLFSDEIACEAVAHDVGVHATAIAIQAVESSSMNQLPEWAAIVGHDTTNSSGESPSQPRAMLEIIDVLSGDCKSRFQLPPQTYFAYSPFTMTALKHKVVMCLHDGRVCIYSANTGSGQQVACNPPLYSLLSGAGNRIISMQKLSGNRGYVAATHHSQLLRCAFAQAGEDNAQEHRAKVAVVSEPAKVSQAIIPAVTALKVTDTTVLCARQGTEVTLEGFDLRRMVPLFAFKRDRFKGVLDVDFDELKIIVLLEDFSAEIMFWHQINSENGSRIRNVIVSATCSVPRYIPTHTVNYLNSGCLVTPDEKFRKIMLSRNMILLSTDDGLRVIWERSKQPTGEVEHKEEHQESDDEESTDSEAEEERRRQQKKREKLEARRKHENSRKKKDKQMDAARRQKYG